MCPGLPASGGPHGACIAPGGARSDHRPRRGTERNARSAKRGSRRLLRLFRIPLSTPSSFPFLKAISAFFEQREECRDFQKSFVLRHAFSGVVFGHELGHYALHHIVLGLLFTAVLLLVAFFVGQNMAEWLLRRFGSRWGIRSQNDLAFLAVLALVLSALSFFSEPIDNAFSRSIEHAADVYGQEAIHGIVADPQTTTEQAFQKLGETSLDDPTPHAFVDFWTASHPSIADRAAFAAAYNPWATGQHPKYF